MSVGIWIDAKKSKPAVGEGVLLSLDNDSVWEGYLNQDNEWCLLNGTQVSKLGDGYIEVMGWMPKPLPMRKEQKLYEENLYQELYDLGYYLEDQDFRKSADIVRNASHVIWYLWARVHKAEEKLEHYELDGCSPVKWEMCDRCAESSLDGRKYCPHCGRPLTEEAWEQLYKKLKEVQK